MPRAARRNPLLSAWKTPFELPPFEAIAAEHFEPAFEAALAKHNAEIARIAANSAKPTFRNTIVALELSGRLLERVSSLFWNLVSAHTNDRLQAIEREMAPRLAAHWNAITSNAALFARIEALYVRRDRLGLTGEELRVLERTHLRFVRAGARLSADGKRRMGKIRERLAALATRFSQNVLADEQAYRLALDGEADLVGLPSFVIDAAAKAAEERGERARHVITLSRSLIEPFLTFSPRRDLREQAYKAWIRRGENGGATDNRALAKEMLVLRQEQAKLLGYDTFAAYRLDDSMAKCPAAVRELIDAIWGPARAKAQAELDKLQTVAAEEGANITIEPWDWRYYAEKVRQKEFAVDTAAIKPYLPLEQVIAAAFATAGRLFGLTFRQIENAPVYHPDVRVFEVRDRDGRHVGLFLGDYFARPSKRSGAWMSSYRSQHRLSSDVRPIVTNVMNFAKAGDGGPTLLSMDDAHTLFHEFGHALHGLLSDVTYPSLSGTAVVRDFVELPSQLYEHWIDRPEVLGQFARHHATGAPMPQAMIEKLRRARTFNQGFATVEFLASAIVDLELHSRLVGDGDDPMAIEAETLARIGMPAEIAMRHRTPHFSHVFAGGYAAGYYSYLWSEVLDADAFAAFEETGDIFDAKTAERLKRFVYSGGGSRKEEEAYLAFRGRMPSVEGLLHKRGLVAG